MSLRLHAVSAADDRRPALPDGAHVVTFRDLAAIVTDAPYVAEEPGEALVAQHARVVASAFEHGELLPAPPGTVFKAETDLKRWMELHYVALSDALTFVADRVGARVHIENVEHHGASEDSGNDLAATAAELMRTLRRRAVAGVPLRREHTTGIAIGVSFLVDRTLWREFQDEVMAAAAGHEATRITLTGPWPPYDFVAIDFGA